MKHYIIAFSGKARSGKNTAASIVTNFLKETKYAIVEKSFAAKLKSIAKELFLWDGDKELYSAKDKGRNLLIELGNHMREIRPSVWVDYIISEMRQTIYKRAWWQQHLFLITDLRYKNEAESLLEASHIIPKIEVILIRLERPGSLHLNNQSETDLDGYNRFRYTIKTDDGDIQSLTDQLKEILLKEDLLDAIH
jgi:hypothetical protein